MKCQATSDVDIWQCFAKSGAIFSEDDRSCVVASENMRRLYEHIATHAILDWLEKQAIHEHDFSSLIKQ